MRGLGKFQIQAQNQTDQIVLEYIKQYPGIHVRKLILKSQKSPNSIIHSIERLLKKNKIMKLTDSVVFNKIKIKKNRIGYVLNYDILETMKKNKIKNLENNCEECTNGIKKMQDADFKNEAPKVKKLSVLLQKLLEKKHESILFEMRNRLGVIKVNESMIGFFIFTEIKKIKIKQNDFPWDPLFYFNMMPKKFYSIKFEIDEDFVNFCNKFQNYELSELIHNYSTIKRTRCFTTQT